MPIDASIPLSGQQVSPMQSLASVVGLAGGIQNFRNAQISNQALQQQAEQGAQDLRERQHAVGVLKNIKSYQDAQGNIDYSRLAPDIMSGAPTTGAQYIQGIAQTQQAAASARKAVDDADTNERQIVGNLLYSLKGKPPMMVHDVLTGVKEKYPNLLPAVEFSGKYLIAPAVQGSNSPNPQLDAALDQAGRMFQGSQTQQVMQTPSGVTVSTGQKTYAVNTKPGASVPQGGVIPGTEANMELPPTTPVFDPASQTPGYLGSTHGKQQSGYAGGSKESADTDRLAILQNELKTAKTPEDKAAVSREIARVQGGKTFVQSGPALGQAGNVENNFNEMNRHFSSLNDQSSGAPLVSALTSNIKSLAHGAITGTESGRKSYVTGLLNAFGLGNKATGDVQKDTDLLEKNMAQLNLSSPASTDAMRNLIQAGRPNSHMSEGAIVDAANQVASQVKANMAMRNALSSYKMMGDVNGYTDARQKMEKLADPRIWQYEALPANERKDFMKKIPADDRKELIQKAQKLEEMGMFK